MDPHKQVIRTNNLQFLKLGGSLITDKSNPNTARLDILRHLAADISTYLRENPEKRLVIGHGSGSFGHVAGDQYHTRAGVNTRPDWLGFVEVWRQASALHRIVIEILSEAGLPAISFPPSAAVLAENGKAMTWDTRSIHTALEHGLLPVVYGDVAFDTQLGGTILSTEDLFDFLARQFHPERILLAGLVEGVWEDFPACTRLIHEITTSNIDAINPMLGASTVTDVTGGMKSKVRLSLELCQAISGLEVWIFSGVKSGTLLRALSGIPEGTIVRASPR